MVTHAPAAVSGLSTAEAALRLTRNGPNLLPTRGRIPVWRRVLAQARDPLVVVLLVAAVLTIATGDWPDAIVIAVVIVANTTVGVVQEVKADRAITALAELSAPEARVLRDGEQHQIPAAEVVVGDLLVLAEGDIVPADATLTEAAGVLVDEAALSGESVPVEKQSRAGGEPVPQQAGAHRPEADQPGDRLHAGTVVVRGRGRAVVTATGADSAMGRIARLMVVGSGLTPLQRRLVGVGRVLAGVAVALSTVVLVIGLAQGERIELMVVAAISLVVAAVPESLPAVVTLALALGARRMAGRHALIRRLPAVETLGSVTVLATDKTGTLTEGSMVARRLWTPTGEATVDGTGYRPDGAVRRAGTELTAASAPDLAQLLAAAALCNDAALRPPQGEAGGWSALGDPTEAALLVAAGKLGLSTGELTAAWPRRAEVPFDSVRKQMTTV
ncbi:MAG: HAD-IC family P-type ATPase, partial [Micromonosporaceae bacterium]|nr:HAD-IC family P-type ATPase [Micromonosporaceae bacterium]